MSAIQTTGGIHIIFFLFLDKNVGCGYSLEVPPVLYVVGTHNVLSRHKKTFNIGIKHGFSVINIRQVQWEVLKTEAGGRGFHTS